MNARKALAITLAAAAASLTATPAALAWPTCSHPAITSDTTSYEAAVQRAIREHLNPRRGVAGSLRETEDGPENPEAQSPDQRIRSLEGLAFPAQPRSRM